MDPRFVHLHLHSEYSLVDGLVRIKPLVKAVAKAGMPAVAITDQCNFFALVRFYKAAIAAGIKPIAGADLWVRNPENLHNPHRLVLLVENGIGYRNLTGLISRAYVEGQHPGDDRPQVDPAWIAASADGLIALSGGPRGDVAEALLKGDQHLAEQRLERWVQLFGDRYYLELIRTGREREAELVEASVALALRCDVPVVATNDVRFLATEDFEAHEVRVCIHQGRTLDDRQRPREYSPEQYLRTPEEMVELFADLPEALENSVEIAKRCNLEPELGKNYLPNFPIPEGMTVEDFFSEQSRRGLEERLKRTLEPNDPDLERQRRSYHERLELELGVINQMGFPGYFLIVADFIQWAKDQGIPVGPGRGSGAGSLVAYALKITDLDPIEHDLLFERFLNPERVSMPDFDVDFCMEGRDRVIDYVARKYGREAVSQIITFGTMAAKAVVRDVGRVMGHPYGFVDRVAKMVPFELGMTLEKALAESDDLRAAHENDEEVRELIEMARKLEGLTRNAGKHAGGVVIAPTTLTDFAPLYCEPGGVNLVSQYDKDDVEQVGLVKFDFLGLRTLTIIDWALKTVNERRLTAGESPLEIERIDPADGESFALLKRCETTAVFQLESRGMKELIKKLQPDCFGDITALVALFRPGPLQSGMVDDFIERKHGRAEVAYPHPDLEPILKPTYGIILYQEQVMQIAQVLAGYSLGGADLLRRAIGKKKPAEMEKQRKIFMEGSGKRGVDPEKAAYIFDLMDKFAGYGFNKTVHKDTLVSTRTGVKRIEDCGAGDVVMSMEADGRLVWSRVVALHDHGQVPLWEVEFDDNTTESCTLDHKWLTRHGQWPLWKIIQLGEQVWGTTADAAGCPCTSEGMSIVPGPNSYWTDIGERASDALWSSGAHACESNRAFSPVLSMSGAAPSDTGRDLQETHAYRGNAPSLFGNGQAHVAASGDSAGARRTLEELAREQSGSMCVDSGESPRISKTLENGSVACAPSRRTGLCPQFPIEVRDHSEANRFSGSRSQVGDRGRWGLAFSADSLESLSCQGSGARSNARSGDSATWLEARSAVDGAFSFQDWRTCTATHGTPEDSHRRSNVGGHPVRRRPVRIRFLGWDQGYDLEVDHPSHNFLLASGLCCSNSHSAAYALVSYQTLWLKAHYPAAFMAAVLSADMDNTDKVVTLIDECRTMQLKVEPPAVNRSAYRFTIADDSAVIYGLGAIKGVGEGAIEAMIAAREQGGPFRDLWDFCRRIDLHKANRRVLEALIRAGALDELGTNRATLMAELPLALKLAEQYHSTRAAGQVDLFGAMEPASASAPDPQLASLTRAEWDDEERLQGEKETLGLYLTGHPIARYDTELRALGHQRIARLLEADRSTARRERDKRTVIGLVVSVRHGKTQRGRMGSVVLDDRSGRIEVTLFSDVYEQYRELLTTDQILVIRGSLNFDEYRDTWTLRADEVRTFAQAREARADHLALTLDLSAPAAHAEGHARVAALRTILTPACGGSMPIRLRYQCPGASGELLFGPRWRVHPSDALLKQLRELLGPQGVEVRYERVLHAAPPLMAAS